MIYSFRFNRLWMQWSNKKYGMNKRQKKLIISTYQTIFYLMI